MGLIKRDARMVNAIHSVNEQGAGKHLQPYQNGLESAEKESTIGISHGVSQREVVQRSGVGVVPESALGMRMEL
jgi:hypothetical protein